MLLHRAHLTVGQAPRLPFRLSVGRRSAEPTNRFFLETAVARSILSPQKIGAISSVVERLLHTQEVAGSNPASRRILRFMLRAGAVLKSY
jgi:hypothetical protein